MGYTGYFYRLACRLLSRLRFASKIFFGLPLDENQGDPIL
jgi:hypothetical protein